jgi:hypothetical protein
MLLSPSDLISDMERGWTSLAREQPLSVAARMPCDLRSACHRTAWSHGLVAHGH